MKKWLPLLCILSLLAACGQESAPIWTPSSPVVSAPSLPPSPAASPENLWEALRVEDLPIQTADLSAGLLFSSPQVFLLGRVDGAVPLALYGLNMGYGGGVLVRRGDELFHFDQEFSPADSPALPALYCSDYDGDGVDELAVRYLMRAQGEEIVYDLHIYDWEDGLCNDCPITQDSCAGAVQAAVTFDYDAATGAAFLSYGATSARYQVPASVRGEPAELSLDTGFFREKDGVFTVVLGARLSSTGTWFANILADLSYSGGDFSLRNIRVEPTTVV